MQLFTDLSIDLETLGTEPGAVITQIGLCAFNADGSGGTPPSDLIHVDPQSGFDCGMHASWSTISWWLQQAEKPRLAMAHAVGVSVFEATMAVRDFCALNLDADFKVWGNGATFDVSLLNDAYRRVERKVPWGFRDVRDLRTLCALCPAAFRAQPQVAHDARSDAVAQALTVQNCTVWLTTPRPQA